MLQALGVTMKRIIQILILTVLSPTWAIAAFSKRNAGSVARANGITRRNYLYAFWSLFALLALDQYVSERSSFPGFTLYVVYFFAYAIIWARCNEIMFAFLGDALDKSARLPSKSTLNSRRRIELALISYLELILNFAFLYLLLMHPIGAIDVPRSATDAFYFSGVTITTLGYGDFRPDSVMTKLLVVQEVLAGFTLLIVSFAVYAGREVNDTQQVN